MTLEYRYSDNIILVNCNLFTHGALRSSWELVQTCPCFPDLIGIWKCWFLRRGENRSTRRKTSRSKGENQQQTQPTYGVDARIRTRATLVGGECSHHCAAPILLRAIKTYVLIRPTYQVFSFLFDRDLSSNNIQNLQKDDFARLKNLRQL